MTNKRQSANRTQSMQVKKTFFLGPEWILAILITAVICVIHFYYWLHVGGLWRDEVNVVDVSQHSFFDMAKDSFPILMPLLVHIWKAIGFGDNDLHLRLIGLFVGLGTLATLWIAGWKIRRAPPLIGLVLLGLNVTLIIVGDSLRAYGLGTLLAVALTASAFAFLDKPSGLRATWLILFAVLSVQVLYHNAVVVAAVCFGAWAVCWRRKDGRAALKVLLVAVISVASLLPYLANLKAAADTSQVLRKGIALPYFFANLNQTFAFPRWDYLYVWALLYALIIIYFVAGRHNYALPPELAGTAISKRDLSLFATIVLGLEIVGFAAFFWRAQIPIEGWYLLPFMASAVVCFDATLPFHHWASRTALLVFAIVTACLSAPYTRAVANHPFSDIDLYARQLSAAVSPNDYVVVCPWYCGITFSYYSKSAAPWDTVPPISDHSVHRYDLLQLQLENTNAIAPMLKKITQTLQSGHRVWILAQEGWMRVPTNGTAPLPILPPPPLRKTGWSDTPYIRVWASQLSCFLAGHSINFERVQSQSTERFLAENMNLLVADGWNTNCLAPANPKSLMKIKAHD